MFHWLPAPLLGVISALALLINTLIWCVPVYALIFVKLMTPKGPLRGALSRAIAWSGPGFIASSSSCASAQLPALMLANTWR